eukprot:403371352
MQNTSSLVEQEMNQDEESDLEVPQSKQMNEKTLETQNNLEKQVLKAIQSIDFSKQQTMTNLKDQKQLNKDIGNSKSDLKQYIQENSLVYDKVLDVRLLAKGGEAVVYRLEHIGKDEVVIKTTIADSHYNQIEGAVLYQSQLQSAYLDIMSETQNLKLLHCYQYIANVKEGIIEFDFDQGLIQKYFVIVERAQHSLYDLIKILNNEELSEKYNEHFINEKLAYYFYQTLQIMAYLHQRNIYYGDMKPHNLLVFRDQQVKVGDLGISIKLDTKKQDDQKLYKLKGLTKAYSSFEMLSASLFKRIKQHKKQQRSRIFFLTLDDSKRLN